LACRRRATHRTRCDRPQGTGSGADHGSAFGLMHLLATQTGQIDGGAEAVDLAQSPGDIVILSAADSELASLARAFDALANPKPSLRLVNILQLQHNLSIDLYIEKTLRHAKLIVLRLLGGAGYWTYGLNELVAFA